MDLCAELPCNLHGRAYATVPALDLVPMNTAVLERAARAIDSAMAHGPVLVCCALGYSRSAAAAAAWLIVHGLAASAVAAVSLIRAARPQIVLGKEQLRALDALAAQCRQP